MGGGERWAWRVYLTGFTLFTIGGFGAYYGSWVNPAMINGAFVALVIPGVLITLIGGTWLGIVLLRRGFRPRVTAVLLALVFPLVIVVQMVMSLGSAFIPMLIAWGFAGRAIVAEEAGRQPRPCRRSRLTAVRPTATTPSLCRTGGPDCRPADVPTRSPRLASQEPPPASQPDRTDLLCYPALPWNRARELWVSPVPVRLPDCTAAAIKGNVARIAPIRCRRRAGVRIVRARASLRRIRLRTSGSRSTEANADPTTPASAEPR